MDHTADVVADFRQYYGVDVPWDTSEEIEDLPRFAILWSELPRESRTARRIEPSNSWDDRTQMLQRIEYWAHWLQWSRTEDARRKRNRPKPLEPPWETRERRERAERSVEHADEIARALGYDPGEL